MDNPFFPELIKVAMGTLEMLSSTPTNKEWTELFSLAQRQTLVGVCFSGIERLPSQQRPPRELLMQWWAMTRQIEERNRIMDKRSEQATQYFRSHGFKTAILKGQGIAQLYPKPERRQSGDVDIWTVPDVMNGEECKGKKCARELIYEFGRGHDPEGKLHGVNYHHIHYHLFNDTEVEVHIYPTYLHNPFLNQKLHRFFDTYPPTKEPTPSLAFNRVFILLHTYNHLLGHGVGLRQVMDYYYVLINEKCKKDDGTLTEEAKDTVAWVEKLGLMRFAKAIMWVMKEMFGIEEGYMFVAPDKKEGRFLLNEIFQTGNMGHYEKRNWGSLKTPVSRFFYNLRRDWHFISHYPQEVLWQPLFSIWMNIRRYFWTRNE